LDASIVLVDSEPKFLVAFERLLRRLRCQTLCAQRLSEALQYLSSAHIALVVVEPCLVDGDGLELVRIARRMRPPASAIVIKVSWNDPRVSLLDLQYHDMRPDRNVYNHLAALGMVERITNDAAVERAMTNTASNDPRKTAGRVHPAAGPERERLPSRLGPP
jgi:CheY-like chemotaxis protein